MKILCPTRVDYLGKKRRLSWAVMLDGKAIWSLNSVPKESVYGEPLRKFRGVEYRRWDPTRSKLGAGLSRAKKKSIRTTSKRR